jgi:hypothetical protein
LLLSANSADNDKLTHHPTRPGAAAKLNVTLTAYMAVNVTLNSRRARPVAKKDLTPLRERDLADARAALEAG